MNLYLFEANAEFLTFAPTDPNGVPIGYGRDECRIHQARTAHVRAMYGDRNDTLPDRLSVGVNRFVVLRSTVANALVSQHRVPTDLLAVPVVVLSKNGKQRLSEEFVLLHSDAEYDILDRADSEYIAVHRGEHIEVVVSVTKWCVREASVPPLDMIPAQPNDWIVTEVIKDMFDRCEATGVKLTKLNVA